MSKVNSALIRTPTQRMMKVIVPGLQHYLKENPSKE